MILNFCYSEFVDTIPVAIIPTGGIITHVYVSRMRFTAFIQRFVHTGLLLLKKFQSFLKNRPYTFDVKIRMIPIATRCLDCHYINIDCHIFYHLATSFLTASSWMS